MTPVEPGHGRDKALCGARKRQGTGTCTRPAGWGTDHVGIGACKLHGGSTSTHRKRAAAAAAAIAVETLGLPVDVDPHTALLEEVHRTAGHVAWLAAFVGALEHEDLKQLDASGRFERPSVWYELYQQERRHLVTAAKAAADAGVDERRVRMVEAEAFGLAPVLRAVFADLAERLVVEADRGALDAGRVRELWEVELPEIVQRRVLEAGGELGRGAA